MEYNKVDQGTSRNGVFWEILQPKLRHVSVWEVRVAGTATQFRSKDAAYQFLEASRVTEFHKAEVTERKSFRYTQKTPEELANAERELSDSNSGDDVQ